MWDYSLYINNIIELYNNSFYLSDIFKYSNIGIFTKRMKGKSMLSSSIILNYINLNKNCNIYSLYKQKNYLSDNIKKICFFNKLDIIDLSSKIENIHEFVSLQKFYNNLIINENDINIIFIDDFTYYLKYDNFKLYLEKIIHKILQYNIKFIINGDVDNYSEINYLDLNMKIIDDKIIDNLLYYNRNKKIEKIIKNG